MPIKAFKYRLYPNKTQEQKLLWTLERCRELYNAALQERRDAYRMCGKSIKFFQQSAQLPQIKEIRQEYKDIYGQVLVNVLQRVDGTFTAFFRRCKNGEKPGHPRFKGKGRYDSFTYPQVGDNHGHYYGPHFEGNRLVCPKIGSIKIKLHRPIEGRVKTATIKQESDVWYVYFACEIETEKLPISYEDIGIDLGITHFAALSDGTFIDNPRYYRKAEKKLARAHQSLDRKKRGSHRREKAKKTLSRAYRKVHNQRSDFLHKSSHKLINRYQVIVFEDLQTENMVRRPKPKQDEATGQYLPNGASAKSGLNKSIQDAGWGQFQRHCIYKAANAGRTVLFVNPQYTSQACSGCGAVKKKTLDERWHSCECGTELDRDVNAAINILRLGRSLQEDLRSPQGSRHPKTVWQQVEVESGEESVA